VVPARLSRRERRGAADVPLLVRLINVGVPLMPLLVPTFFIEVSSIRIFMGSIRGISGNRRNEPARSHLPGCYGLGLGSTRQAGNPFDRLVLS
jgi:hypothetical protein